MAILRCLSLDAIQKKKKLFETCISSPTAKETPIPVGLNVHFISDGCKITSQRMDEKKMNDLDWLYLTNSSTVEMLLSIKDFSVLWANGVDDRREEAEGALRLNYWIIDCVV